MKYSFGLNKKSFFTCCILGLLLVSMPVIAQESIDESEIIDETVIIDETEFVTTEDITESPEAANPGPELFIWSVDLAYLGLGVDIPLPAFIPDQKTSLRPMLGGGFWLGREIWVDQNGAPLVGSIDLNDTVLADERGFQRIDMDAKLLLRQGLIQGDRSNPALAIYAGYAGHFNTPVENGSTSTFMSSPVFPDYQGVFYNSLLASIEYDTLAKGTAATGELAWLRTQTAPLWLLNQGLGKTDFFWTALEGNIMRTLVRVTSDSGLNLFSIAVADKFQFDFVPGAHVPEDISKEVSLGNKVRGLQGGSKASSLSVSNNLEVHLNGPDIAIEGVYPNLRLFLDTAWHGGTYFNTSIPADGHVITTGVELGLSVFNFVNLGWRMTWLLSGENFGNNSSSGLMITGKF